MGVLKPRIKILFVAKKERESKRFLTLGFSSIDFYSMKTLRLIFITILFLINSCTSKQEIAEKNTFTTPLGLVKTYNTPGEKLITEYQAALENYKSNPDNAENIIWLGRRTAYMGQYNRAIQVYSEGIQKFPDNAKFYRHRGHRYISIREYEKAIADLSKAAELIEGTDNEIEQDGMPNARNIPVSSLHGNIYYHLGLAYYLVHDYEKAFEAYIKCRDSANNPDNIVSSTHWLYMIQQRLDNRILADSMLTPIETDFDVIENHDYYTLCLFYKGLISEDSIVIDGDSPSSDALKYGLANWFYYNSEKEQAGKMFDAMVKGDSWTSFGYLAAESDIIKYYKE